MEQWNRNRTGTTAPNKRAGLFWSRWDGFFRLSCWLGHECSSWSAGCGQQTFGQRACQLHCSCSCPMKSRLIGDQHSCTHAGHNHSLFSKRESGSQTKKLNFSKAESGPMCDPNSGMEQGCVSHHFLARVQCP